MSVCNGGPGALFCLWELASDMSGQPSTGVALGESNFEEQRKGETEERRQGITWLSS